MSQFKKRRIHTLIEYQFNKATGQYDEVRDDFYYYDGPVALAGGDPTRESGSWAFYSDGTESGAVIIGSLNTNPTLEVDTIYHFRQVMEETAGNTWTDLDIQLEYNLNGGGWNDVNAASSVVRSAPTSGLTEGGDTTDRISGTGTFEDYAGQDDTDGYTTDGSRLGNEYVNAVYAFTIISSDVADEDTIVLRLWDTVNADAFDINQQTNPTITVNEAAAPELAEPTNGIITTVGNVATVTYELEQTTTPTNGVITTVGNVASVEVITPAEVAAPSVGIITTIGYAPEVALGVAEEITVNPTTGLVTALSTAITEVTTYDIGLNFTAYRWRADNDNEILADWLQAPSTPHTFNLDGGDVEVRLRLLIQELNGAQASDVKLALVFQVNGGGYNLLTDVTTHAVYYNSINLNDEADTTQQLGVGSFITDNNGVQTDGTQTTDTFWLEVTRVNGNSRLNF